MLVTGGASGLGAASARAIQAKGAHVAVMDLRLEDAQRIASAVGGVAVGADITDIASLKQAFAELSASLGTLDVLVHCAGTASMGPVIAADVDAVAANVAQAIAINLTGALNTAALFANQVARENKDEDNGVIIFTASGAAFDGVPGASAYSAAKGGVVSMTLALARELGERGIRVNTISPGPMATPMLEDVPTEYVDAIGQQTPFSKRPGDPTAFADLAVHICENGHMNGAVLRLDGGHRTPYP
ncbi:MAG: SDR family oxidoreductase [Pseudomonadota bacterium]